MNADDLKKLTTDALDRLATLLDAGHSDQCFPQCDGALPSLQLAMLRIT